MAATGQGVNILRYSALAFGIFYGFTHQNAIHSSTAQQEADHAWQKKEDMISKAKAEWTKRTMPQQSRTEGGGVISDPNDKNFDLEAWLTHVQADNTQTK